MDELSCWTVWWVIWRRSYRRMAWSAKLLPRRLAVVSRSLATDDTIDSGTHQSLSSNHTHPGTEAQFGWSLISYIAPQKQLPSTAFFSTHRCSSFEPDWTHRSCVETVTHSELCLHCVASRLEHTGISYIVDAVATTSSERKVATVLFVKDFMLSLFINGTIDCGCVCLNFMRWKSSQPSCGKTQYVTKWSMIEYDCLGRLSSGNATGIKRETSSESQQKTKHSIVNVFFCDLHGAFFKIVCRIQPGFKTVLTWAKIVKNCKWKSPITDRLR